MNIKIIIALFFFLKCFGGFSQDTLHLNNGNVIIGELKTMDRGVLTIETVYSDSDFKIEWDGVKKINTGSIFLITTINGERLKGSITKGDSIWFNINNAGTSTRIAANDIVYLKLLDEGFWNQIYANIDVGINLTKSQNLKQYTINAGVGYKGEKWSWDARYNSLKSTQDSIMPTARADGGLNMNFYLPHDWFVITGVDFLSNNEQLLDLRLNGKLGLGYYIIHSNKMYWGISGGAAYVNENYNANENDKQSMEGFIGTEINMFDFGDLSLFSTIIAYPGITEKGRFRTDFRTDVKYDLPKDFYIKLGFTVNYDNQPVEGAESVDYIMNTGFGWEW